MEPIQSSSFNEFSESMEACIQDCVACYRACMRCLPHCLGLGGEHAEQKHIGLMMECAQLCNLSATMMELKSQFAFEQCQLCAKACDACATSCSSVDSDDSMMQQCADACTKCAEACRAMSH